MGLSFWKWDRKEQWNEIEGAVKEVKNLTTLFFSRASRLSPLEMMVVKKQQSPRHHDMVLWKWLGGRAFCFQGSKLWYIIYIHYNIYISQWIITVLFTECQFGIVLKSTKPWVWIGFLPLSNYMTVSSNITSLSRIQSVDDNDLLHKIFLSIKWDHPYELPHTPMWHTVNTRCYCVMQALYCFIYIYITCESHIIYIISYFLQLLNYTLYIQCAQIIVYSTKNFYKVNMPM